MAPGRLEVAGMRERPERCAGQRERPESVLIGPYFQLPDGLAGVRWLVRRLDGPDDELYLFMRKTVQIMGVVQRLIAHRRIENQVVVLLGLEEAPAVLFVQRQQPFLALEQNDKAAFYGVDRLLAGQRSAPL